MQYHKLGGRSEHGASSSVSHTLDQPVEPRRGGYHLPFRAEGIESRSVHPGPIHALGSVAEDGGLIEINVFRGSGPEVQAAGPLGLSNI